MIIHLSYDRVAIATLLILINGGISLALKLGLERRLLVAAFATVVQLLLIGLVLDWIFRVNRWYFVLGLMLVMTIVAGSAAIRRTHVRYPGIWLSSIVSVWASSWLMTALAPLRHRSGQALVLAPVCHPTARDDSGQHLERHLARARPARE